MQSDNPYIKAIIINWENRLKSRHIWFINQALIKAKKKLQFIILSLAKPYSKKLIITIMSINIAFRPKY